MRRMLCLRCTHCSFYQEAMTAEHLEISATCTKGLLNDGSLVMRCSGFDRKGRRKGKPSWLR